MRSPTSSAASPRRFKTLPRGAFAKDAETLTAIFSEFDVAGIVLGLPLDLDGRDNPRAQSTRAFGRNLSTRTSLPIVLWDERFSTAVVTRSLIANDVSRARRAQVVDKMAAAYILQGALDRLGGLTRPQTGARSLSQHFCRLSQHYCGSAGSPILSGTSCFSDRKSASHTV